MGSKKSEREKDPGLVYQLVAFSRETYNTYCPIMMISYHFSSCIAYANDEMNGIETYSYNHFPVNLIAFFPGNRKMPGTNHLGSALCSRYLSVFYQRPSDAVVSPWHLRFSGFCTFCRKSRRWRAKGTLDIGHKSIKLRNCGNDTSFPINLRLCHAFTSVLSFFSKHHFMTWISNN